MHYIDQFLSGQYISQSTRLRAREMYSEGRFSLLSLDAKLEKASYTVQSDNGNSTYKVDINYFNSPNIAVSCNCPANVFCKHALIALNDLRAHTTDIPVKRFNQQETYVDSQGIFTNILGGHYSTIASFKKAAALCRNQKVSINQASEGEVKAIVNDDDRTFLVVLTETEERKIRSSCRCAHTETQLCAHKIAVLLCFKEQYGNKAFENIRNYDSEKEVLLQQYGYTLSDDIKEIFDFKVEKGKLQLIVKDPNIEKVGKHAEWKTHAAMYLDVKPTVLLERKEQLFTIAYAWEVIDNALKKSSLRVVPIYGKKKKNGKIGAPLKEIDSHALDEIELSEDSLLIYQSLTNLDEENFIVEGEPSEDGKKDLKEEGFSQYFLHQERIYQVVGDMYEQLSTRENYLVREAGGLTPGDLEEIKLNTEIPNISFNLTRHKTYYDLTIEVQVNENIIGWQEFVPVGYGFLALTAENELFMLSSKDARTLVYFNGKSGIKVKSAEFKVFFNDFIIPLVKKHPVKFINMHVDMEDIEVAPKRKLYVKEMDNFLLLIPAFRYVHRDIDTEVEMDNGEAIIFERTGKKKIVRRDKEAEEEMKNLLMGLHADFEKQSNRHYFYLPIDKVLASNWFFQAFDKINENNIEVLGLKSLSKIKYNPFRPKMLMTAGSGTDWFDLSVQVSFGSQVVRLQDIRKAILHNDQYVKLGDGTMGILPEEWLKKYSTMFRAAKVKADGLQLSKFQYAAIEGFYKEIDNNEVLLTLRKKIEKLKTFRKIKQTEVPANVKAELRNYQKEGFNWLRFLQEFGWGGCLADDMGLGKTLQALTFIQSLVNEKNDTTVLVVVPRSLVFNWQNEAEKFCPELSLLVYSGGERRKELKKFDKHHIVLTTYSLVRNDIQMLREFSFDYVVLDESQAIKNPTSLISKAVKLLKTTNRLIMTGTPVENNTFDLYAQMDFLNPGMLGSMDFFRKEYANKIDRDRDKNKAEELQKLINPFILSRKKEEVAKELPEKTETVIYCELGQKQRKTYDYFKNMYYEKIKEVIAQEGMGKSGMHILQGLLKLRQICNSTALIKEEGDFGKESVKLEILTDEIRQVTEHKGKALVFSYFVEMLDLVRKELEAMGVSYSMLTGSTVNREKVVDDFKNNDNNQVFLISLKAGGFGLNLTEANYVFMVDPWWNPAVEQQAIDRTHRIGQDQKVFAYKLICKNTIEEKILELQQKKQEVAKDIINVEAGFIKKLNEEDLKALFS